MNKAYRLRNTELQSFKQCFCQFKITKSTNWSLLQHFSLSKVWNLEQYQGLYLCCLSFQHQIPDIEVQSITNTTWDDRPKTQTLVFRTQTSCSCDLEDGTLDDHSSNILSWVAIWPLKRAKLVWFGLFKICLPEILWFGH